jgi:hypothetical protein
MADLPGAHRSPEGLVSSRGPLFRYHVVQEVEVEVWAANEDGAMWRSARIISGPWWQHVWLWRWLPWSRRRVRSVGRFEITRRNR